MFFFGFLEQILEEKSSILRGFSVGCVASCWAKTLRRSIFTAKNNPFWNCYLVFLLTGPMLGMTEDFPIHQEMFGKGS